MISSRCYYKISPCLGLNRRLIDGYNFFLINFMSGYLIIKILLQARLGDLIHESITLHIYELIQRLMAFLRSRLQKERGKFFSLTRICGYRICVIKIYELNFRGNMSAAWILHH